MTRALQPDMLYRVVLDLFLAGETEATIKRIAQKTGYSEGALRKLADNHLPRELAWTSTYVENIDGYGNTRSRKAMALRVTEAELAKLILRLRETNERLARERDDARQMLRDIT